MVTLSIQKSVFGIKYVIFAVTPFAGVWIEIKEFEEQQKASESLPSRESGLKSASSPVQEER